MDSMMKGLMGQRPSRIFGLEPSRFEETGVSPNFFFGSAQSTGVARHWMKVEFTPTFM